MTPAERAAIRDALAQATTGPWFRKDKSWDGDRIMAVSGKQDEEEVEVVQEPTDFYNYPSGSFIQTDGVEANMDLIAHAPGWLAALLDEVERLEGIVKAYEDIGL